MQEEHPFMKNVKFPPERTEFHFKIIIIGDPCCGKTSLMMRTALSKRNEVYDSTVGVDFKSRTFNFEDKKVRLQIWDTAGQERFTNITTSYYRGTHCCILVFDITNKDSFFNLYKWIDQYNAYNDLPVKHIVIIGNKHDLEHKRAISRMEIKQFCDSLECDYVEVSVLENRGIDELMTMVIQKCLDVNLLMEQQDSHYNYVHKNSVMLGGMKPSIANIEPI